MSLNTEYVTFAMRFVAVLHLAALSALLLCHSAEYGFSPMQMIVALFLALCSAWLIYLSLFLKSSDKKSGRNSALFSPKHREF